MDGVLSVVQGLTGGLVYAVTLMAIVGVFWGARWAINHGVDSVAALFGRGPKAKR